VNNMFRFITKCAPVVLIILFGRIAFGFQSARGLTLDQIENLLSAGAPATAIAKEIDSRVVS
jgi:hypothetical protein